MARPIGTFLTKTQRVERFLTKTRKRSGGCIDWTGSKFKSGYGVCTWKNRDMRAHRVAFELFKGEIPVGAHVLHKCDRPICVNPKHLFLGNAKINSDDKIKKGRFKTERGEVRYNAKLNPEKVRQIRTVFAKGGATISELANLYGVNNWTITNVVLRRRWKHVT